MVFYRKYRPQKISELDSLELQEKIFNIISGSSIPHAFLFTGPKGLGKTSTARIIAKAVNCEKNKSKKDSKKGKEEIEPCNECQQCISITNGNNLDILEIDGASNRGIDEIRDLREKIKLSPVSAKKKIYIIDEVHMLTTEAFNALLKTLEEPPNHAIFILCTTEPHKVPETIMSRSFHIAFKKASNEELTRSLQRIAKGEGLNLDKEAVFEIAKLSDGGFRDGAKVLEELSLLAKGETITKELLEKKYQTSNIQFQISNLIKLLEEKDTKKALTLIKEVSLQGIEMKFFIEQLIDRLHKLLLQELGIEKEDANEKLKLDTFQIKELIELLIKAHSELKYAVLPQLPLELLVVEWGIKEKEGSKNLQLKKEDTQEVKEIKTEEKRINKDTDTNNDGIWKNLLDGVKKENYSIAGVLRGCSLKSYNGKDLVIETAYKFHKDKLLEPKTISLLEKIGEEIIGNKLKILVELKTVN